MSRQHAAPILVPASGVAQALIPAETDWSEATIQALVQAYPACLPIREIDPLFADAVPLCTELNCGSGYIDNVMITASGLPVLVECKLWRNPQARREVIGQILDDAKNLSRWSASDLQREVSRRTGRAGNEVLELVREAGHMVDEIAFTDALTLNLRRGRFLLLLVGDGIREGVEAIAEYLQGHAGLHFTLGLVEMPIYAMPDGGRLVAPRVLARTETILRTVVELPVGLALEEATDVEDDDDEQLTPSEREGRAEGRKRRAASRYAFWTEFLEGLQLDDPERVVPKPSRSGNIAFKFPAPGGSSWVSVYRSGVSGRVGLFLSGNRNSPGESAARALEEDAAALREQLGPSTRVAFGSDFPVVSDSMALLDFDDAQARAEVFVWLRRRTNDFINALRPRIRAALNDGNG